MLSTASAIAERLAAGPARRRRLTKRALNHWLRQALPNFEASLAYEMLNFLGPDAAEGVAALPREAAAPSSREGAKRAMDRDLAADLAFGLELAKVADGITLPYFEQRSFDLDWKPNRTEVTEADRQTESAISAQVLAQRPSDGLFGEEHGLVGNTGSPWRWMIDPIDGTSNFVRGIPVWATLIALTHVEHGPVVGVVSAPALDSPVVGGQRARRVCRRSASVTCRPWGNSTRPKCA